VRQDRVRAVHVAQQVRLDHAAMGFHGRFVEQADGADAHVVDPQVHVPEVRDGGIGQRA
jgi:hypothetical protein